MYNRLLVLYRIFICSEKNPHKFYFLCFVQRMSLFSLFFIIMLNSWCYQNNYEYELCAYKYMYCIVLFCRLVLLMRQNVILHCNVKLIKPFCIFATKLCFLFSIKSSNKKSGFEFCGNKFNLRCAVYLNRRTIWPHLSVQCRQQSCFILVVFSREHVHFL